jgi:DNA-binding protein HU-beta
VVDAVCEVIKNELQKEDGRVPLPGFGTFSTVKRKARPGRNLDHLTGLGVAARRVPQFSAGKSFKESIR